MSSLPISTIVEQSNVSPPPATVSDMSLSLTFSDILWLPLPPLHPLFFYNQKFSISNFIQTIIPNIKHSLSITLQYFPIFAGNLIIFFDSNQTPEIRYIKDQDSVNVTFSECNLDFVDLTGYHPRKCENFYHLIPTLSKSIKLYDHIKIPVFAVQVTLFPNHGISIGITGHHSLGDATSYFSFFNAWASITRCGTDESFLSNGTFPLYERLLKYPKLDEFFLKIALAKFTKDDQDYQVAQLSGPSDKLRATFVLKKDTIQQLKKFVSTQLPTLEYVSSFTVTCAYIWCCITKSRKINIDHSNRLHLFAFNIDLRPRLQPPIPENYFGNCLKVCFTVAEPKILTGHEGLLTAAKLIGENLHKIIAHKDEIMKAESFEEISISNRMITTTISVSGSSKLDVYDLDFGWGKCKKVETVSLDYNEAISLNVGKESNDDVEIGVCLTATEMQAFVNIFNQGVKLYI